MQKLWDDSAWGEIDETNRLIFKISNSILKIVACRGHYEDG